MNVNGWHFRDVRVHLDRLTVRDFMEARDFTELVVEDDLNDIFLLKPMNFSASEHLFESVTHDWGWECAKPELEAA